MKSIAAGFLVAFLVSAPALAFASSPPPTSRAEVCKSLLADERELKTRIAQQQEKAATASAAISEADRAIKDLAGNPAMASAVADLKADRARQVKIRDAALARAQADKKALEALEEQALRLCPKQSPK
jgi:hypothetical protein